MKINFEFLDIEGVRSIVNPFHFNLDKPGLNMLKGPNGAGKTTVFESLAWCLYGINLKDVNQDALITWPENRTSQWKGTRVSVTFHILNDTYCVSRHLSYKGLTYDVKGEDYLMLAKGDDERGQNVTLMGDYRNKKETQEAINKLLGMDARTFTNSILFGQRIAKLIQQDNKDKRELFETLFETEWVGNLKLKCDADITKFEKELADNKTSVTLQETTISSKKTNLQTTKDLLATFEVGKQTRITAKQHNLGEYLTSLIDLNLEKTTYEQDQEKLNYSSIAHAEAEKIFDNLVEKINVATLADQLKNSTLTAAQTKVTNLEKDLVKDKASQKKIKDMVIDETCPHCGQELLEGNQLEQNHTKDLNDAKAVTAITQKALDEANKELKKLQKVKIEDSTTSLNTQKDEAEVKLTAMDVVKADYDALQENLRLTLADITQAEKDVDRVNKEIEAIKAEIAPEINLTGLGTALAAEQIKLETLQHNKPEIEHKLEIAKWWSSKAFGAGGVKAFVFSAMLNTLNQCVKKYGDRLGASLEFSIDLTKASKPFTTRCSLGDKIDKDYKDFSGGEKQRLDIVLLYAMHDLVSAGSDMNILIMDEVLEGLDEEGETIVFDLVREKAESGKSIWMISHSATLDSLYANKTEFTKVNGNTVIIN